MSAVGVGLGAGYAGPIARLAQPLKLLLSLLLFLALAPGTPAHAHGPDEGILQALTTEDGLPLNWVSGFAEDVDGALWIGTDSGLVWYDGVDLLPDPVTAGEQIIQLVEDPRGGAWAAGLERQWRLDGRAVVPLSLERVDLGQPFVVDDAGSVWAVDATGLVSLADRSAHIEMPEDCGRLQTSRGLGLTCEARSAYLTLADGELRPLVDIQGVPLPGPELLRDSRGVSWVRGPAHLRRYVGEARGLRELSQVPALRQAVVAAHESEAGEIWLATEQGRILVWDGVELREHAAFEQRIRGFFSDSEGSIWAATRGLGALRLASPRSFWVLGGSEAVLVWTAVQAADGSTWIGSEAGLTHIAADGAPIPAPPLPTLTSPVRSLHFDARGTLYAGGDAGLWTWDGEHLRQLEFTKPDVRVRGGLLHDRQARVWAGGRYKLWRAPTPQDPLAPVELPVTLGSDYPVMGGIVEDEQGRVWVATNAGLLVWEADGARVVVEGHFRGLSVTREGSVWATRAGGGLVRVRNGQASELGAAQGLPAQTLHAVVFDELGSAWLSSNRGIFRTRTQDLDAAADDPERMLSLSNYGLEDGLPSLECNSGHPSGMVDTDGRVYFPTMRGLVRVDPSELRRDLNPPIPVIRRVQVDAEDVAFEGVPLLLPPGTRSLVVHYSAPQLRDPAGITYRYLLDGHDADWVDAEHRRVAQWTNLPPGAYTFRLQARSSEGVLSEVEAQLSFTLEAHLYERGWFKLLLALGVLALGGALVGARLRRIRARELAHLVELRTAELQAARDHSAAQASRLELQARELEAVDARKTRFFANVSHELKTPLALILGPVSGALASGKALSTTDVERVDRNARRLEELIEGLLDIARLDAGRLPLQAREQDLAELIRARVEAFAALARTRGIKLVFAGPATRAWCDSRRLGEVVDNLLANALRHTPGGGDVQVVLSSTDTHAELRVADTGSGIAAEHLGHIFERFYQAEGGARGGSAGLGLALSRELVELHGGELRVESELGEGSVFVLRLPLGCEHLASSDLLRDHDDEPASGPGRAPEVDGRASGSSADPSMAASMAASSATVLVVEDDPDMRAFIRQVLCVRYAVLEAEDGVEGLELARTQVPDLVLSDLMMPGSSGLELCAALREDPATSHLPVVMLSARSTADSRIEGLASGVDAYLTKPFHPHELLLQIDNLLAARARLQAQYRRQLVATDDTPKAPSVDERFLAQVREAVQLHMGDENFGVNELAAAVFLSRRQLSRKLSALIGEPPSVLLRRLRLQRGRALLEQDSASISEVAYAVGFRRPARFSEQFRAEFGMSPTQFKHSLAEPKRE